MIYVPRKGICAHVNEQFIKQLNSSETIVRSFKDFVDRMPSVRNLRRSTKFLGVALSLTSDCNMRCRYCYVSGGSRPRYMSWRTAKAAIDWALANSGKRFRIIFQGEGETTLALGLMQKCYEYARSRCLELHKKLFVTVTTNGVVSSAALKWLQKLGPALELGISFDGPPAVQNTQRPLKGGGPSWSIVWRTIELLKSLDIPFTVKTSVTSGSRIVALVRYFHKLGIKKLQIGNIMERGRCTIGGIHAMDMSDFFRQFTRAYELAKRLGMELAPIWSMKLNNACDVCRCLVVTADGHISACLDVLDVEDPAADVFIYGRVVAGHVQLNEQRLHYLRSRTVHKIAACKACFAKWNCGGGCASISLRKNGSIFLPDASLCETIRRSTAYMLDKVLRSASVTKTPLEHLRAL